MSKQKMLAARELINEKRYAEARTLLKTIDDPKAKEWLKKLDQIAPERRIQPLSRSIQTIPDPEYPEIIKKSKKPKSRKLLKILLAILVSLVLVLGALIFLPDIVSQIQCPTRSWWNTQRPIVVEFLDTVEVASTTPRMNVGTVILEMQRLYRDYERTTAPSCASSADSNLKSGMDRTIQGFRDFASNADFLSSVYLDMAAERFVAAKEALWDLRLYNTDIRLSIPETMW